MAKKTKKAVKKLNESVAELQEQNERILQELEQVRESLDRRIGDESAAEKHSGAPEQESEEPEATEAAERKAGELGVELDKVEGSGSGGRITVKDIEKTAE